LVIDTESLFALPRNAACALFFVRRLRNYLSASA
jgi:hypothetical protein